MSSAFSSHTCLLLFPHIRVFCHFLNVVFRFLTYFYIISPRLGSEHVQHHIPGNLQLCGTRVKGRVRPKWRKRSQQFINIILSISWKLFDIMGGSVSRAESAVREAIGLLCIHQCTCKFKAHRRTEATPLRCHRCKKKKKKKEIHWKKDIWVLFVCVGPMPCCSLY